MILFIDFLILLTIMLVILGFVFQVVVPLKNGTPLFPFFRKTETSIALEQAKKELEHVAELEQLNEVQEEINRRKAQLSKKETK